MKKYFFIFILFLTFILSVSAKNVSNELDINSLNSKDLINYLGKQDIKGKTVEVCNQDYCDYLKSDSLKKSIQIYIDNYLDYIKTKTDEDTSVIVSLKGFLITEINIY